MDQPTLRVYNNAQLLGHHRDPFVYRNHASQRRLKCLMFDCVLDLVSSIFLPGTIFYIYLQDYDPVTRTIARWRWYDDIWLVSIWSEYQLVLADSWLNLLNHLAFSFGLLVGMQGVKELLRSRPPKVRPSLARRLSDRMTKLFTVSHAPSPPVTSMGSLRQLSVRIINTARERVRWGLIIHSLFALWGALILEFHLEAEWRSTSAPHCPQVLRPWLEKAVVCPLLKVDCAQPEISGARETLEQVWADLDVSQVRRLVLHHCPQLEIPESFRQFSGLQAIKVYNSTLAQWKDDAALTSSKHPHLRAIQVIRTAMANGHLPPGLVHKDFPQRLSIIELCSTNLQTLPPNLSSIWPKRLRLTLEDSNLMAFPLQLLSMDLLQLSVARNPLASVPSKLLEMPNLKRLSVAHTAITSLPESKAISPALIQLSLVGTSISALPNWFNSVIQRADSLPYLRIALFAGDTSICKLRQAPYALCIDDAHINCDAMCDDVSYPLAFEDLQSSDWPK